MDKRLTVAQLARWRAVAAAASEGPWTWDMQSAYVEAPHADYELGVGPVARVESCRREDNEFIAEARQAVPALLDEWRLMQREIADGLHEIAELREQLLAEVTKRQEVQREVDQLRGQLERATRPRADHPEEDCANDALWDRLIRERDEAKTELEKLQRWPTLDWARASAVFTQQLASLARSGEQPAAAAAMDAFDGLKRYVTRIEADKETLQAERDNALSEQKLHRMASAYWWIKWHEASGEARPEASVDIMEVTALEIERMSIPPEVHDAAFAYLNNGGGDALAEQACNWIEDVYEEHKR
jgi:hypothetical protein